MQAQRGSPSNQVTKGGGEPRVSTAIRIFLLTKKMTSPAMDGVSLAPINGRINGGMDGYGVIIL